MLLARTILINGIRAATRPSRARKAGDIQIGTTLALKTSIPMATGKMFRTTDKCGFRIRIRVGRLIATARGNGNRITVGHGFPTNRGDGPLITTDAGSFTVVIGHGGRVPSESTVDGATILCILPRMFRSSAGAVELASALVSAASAGCHVAPVTSSIHGGALASGAWIL